MGDQSHLIHKKWLVETPKIKKRKMDSHTHTPTLETQAYKSHVVKDPMFDQPKEILGRPHWPPIRKLH